MLNKKFIRGMSIDVINLCYTTRCGALKIWQSGAMLDNKGLTMIENLCPPLGNDERDSTAIMSKLSSLMDILRDKMDKGEAGGAL